MRNSTFPIITCHENIAAITRTRARTMTINKHNAEYIKNLLKPLDYYRYELPNAKLKKYGWNNGGLCPFHSDNKSGSFHVNVATGAYKCFACGIGGGDIIAYTMAVNGIKFTEALALLADDWGLA